MHPSATEIKPIIFPTLNSKQKGIRGAGDLGLSSYKLSRKILKLQQNGKS